MEKKKGLPQSSRTRKTSHLVEELSGKSKTLGRMLSIDMIEANPSQPRSDCGDLEELSRSIRRQGVLEPLLVQSTGERYRLIAGERRLRAAMMAGLTEVPCIEKKVKENELLEISLVENLQRKDLHPFEEADGLKRLSQKFGYSHEEVAHVLGKSRTTVTEIISIAAIPDDLRGACRSADISSKRLLLQIVRGGSPEKMWEIYQQIVEGGASQEDLRQERKKMKQRGRPRYYTFKFQPENKKFSLNLSFRKKDVTPEEVIDTLQDIIRNLKTSLSEGRESDEEQTSMIPEEESVSRQVTYQRG